MNTASITDEFLKESQTIFSMRDQREVALTSSLRADLNATSMQYFALISVVEDLTDVTLTYAQVKNCETLGDILQLAKG